MKNTKSGQTLARLFNRRRGIILLHESEENLPKVKSDLSKIKNGIQNYYFVFTLLPLPSFKKLLFFNMLVVAEGVKLAYIKVLIHSFIHRRKLYSLIIPFYLRVSDALVTRLLLQQQQVL